MICRRKSLEMLAEIERERKVSRCGGKRGREEGRGRGKGMREGDEEVDEVELSYDTVAGSSWPTSFRLCFLRGVAAVLSQVKLGRCEKDA